MAEDYPVRREDWADCFGPLYKFLIDDEITDIDCAGGTVVIGRTQGVRQQAKECLAEGFAEALGKRIAKSVSRPFDREHPVLEAGIESLRITAVHPAASEGGGILFIRKALPRLRLSEETAVRDGFCSPEVLDLLKGFVEAGLSICVTGEAGAGKTECARFLSTFIPEEERVVTIEETGEWHYRELAPGRDAAALLIGPGMDYAKALRTALHLNPSWLLFSEVRGGEVKQLMDVLSSGLHTITTTHCGDVRQIPSRLARLAGSRSGGEGFLNDAYTYLAVGVRVKRRTVACADGSLRTIRSIDQVGLFTREGGRNACSLLVDGGLPVHGPLLPEVQNLLEEVSLRNSKQAEEAEEEEPAATIDHADAEEAIRFAADRITISTAMSDEQKAAEQERMEEIMTELFRLGKSRRTCLGSKSLVEGAASG